MLRLLKESEFDTYIDFAYDLALKPAHSGYPVYYDGVKTKEDFIARARKSLMRPSEDILLFEENGLVEGWIVVQHLEEEHYLHAITFNTRQDTGIALAELVTYCRERWPGFDLDLGFPSENEEANSWLEGSSVPCIERSWNFVCFLDQYTPMPEDPAVYRVTEENFEDFAAIHRKIEGKMYWNCDRVRASLDGWAIFVAGKGDSAGEVLMTIDEDPHQEIFALEFADMQYREEPFRALLTASLNALKKKGAKYLTFFVDEGSECGGVLIGLGFRLVGVCVIHRLKLWNQDPSKSWPFT